MYFSSPGGIAMPRLFMGLLCLILLTAIAAGAEQKVPYKAYVTADNLDVRSGPGDDFYPTDKLRQGDEVEVYRRGGEGWCAIRPPKECFSWISARALKIGGDNLAEVILDNVAVRVGSSLSEVRDVVQVRLKKGETVEVLDPNEVLGEKSQRWCKIAPPSGEFRWVLEKSLDTQKPIGVADATRLGMADSQQDSSNERSEAESTEAGQAASSQKLQADLDRLDLELSMMVVEEPSAWYFDALRIRAESLTEQAEAAADRGKARLLASKIARFEDIKQRFDAVTTMREQNSKSSRFLATLQKTMEKAAVSADPQSQFDGVGQLQQVFAPKAGAPRFALVDEAGNVRYYVTPAPGVSLQNYVGRQVGINGTRGYMPEQRAQHITARHISSLENRIR
jgi:uncharacterized protein YgiM (DUF1202 family)